MVAMTTHLRPDPQKPLPTKPDLQATVAQVVDDVAKDAAFTAALVDEKARVQSIINDLVSNVANPKKSPSSPPQQVDKPPPLPAPVPPGDHRARALPSLPLSWTQAADGLTLSVSVPSSTRKQHVFVSFTHTSVDVCVQDPSAQTVVHFQKDLLAPVDVDGCMWALEGVADKRRLTIELEKARPQWWSRLFSDDDPAQYTIVESQQDESPDTTINEPEEIDISEPSDHIEPNAVENSDPSPSPDTDECISSMEDGVKSVVNDVVDAAVASIPEEDSASGKPTSQKVLTRADLPRIVSQYRTAVEKGGSGAAEAALQLATFYHHGIGVEQNDTESARLYKFALENGALDPSAAFQLGLIYNQGATGMEPDAKEAVRWWRVAASLGNSVAMFNLGVMYMNGSGCEMDPVLATRWFQQAQTLNPQLTPPQFSRTQLEERMAIAARLKKERIKQDMSPEEKVRRKEEALRKVRVLCYGTVALMGATISVVAIRHWWRNHL